MENDQNSTPVRRRRQQEAPQEQPPKGRFRRFCSRHNFRPRSVTLTLIGILTALVLAALLGLGVSTTFQTKTTRLGLQDIGFLETQAGFYTEVESIKKAREDFGFTIPFTTSSYIFTYDGVITAGIDFSKIELTVDELKKEVRVRLPEPVVNHNELDNESFAVLDANKNIFTPLKPEDMNDAQIKIKENAEKDAIANGLLTRAKENAQLLVRGFLSGVYDPNVYNVVFVEEESQ